MMLFIEQTWYAREWEAVSARMDAEEWSMLQPSLPGIHNVLLMVLTMKDVVG